LFCPRKYLPRANGGARLAKCLLVRIDHAQAGDAEIAHGPSHRSDVERIAGVHQHNAQPVEFCGHEQELTILRQVTDGRPASTRSFRPEHPSRMSGNGDLEGNLWKVISGR
jgi:hypothetical protein